ncbi:MAG: hypothetical protein EAZ85_13685 [Bacteroidetes bacterium]|nr:MAG: hypothetical protein EAZ85_13685 [Bacteroidota bacterium]TAG85020.1 MAG: hypothetical protein EAZ20_16150 [Bacteroidota bacterium]
MGNFSKAANFFGFQQDSTNSSIMIVDMPAPFSEISKAITKENLLTKGIILKKIENLVINNLPAILVTGEQNAYGNTYTKYNLMFGTEKETTVINGITLNDFEEVAKEIKKSMLSLVYEAEKKVNIFEIVDFEIDVSETKLIFSKNVANSLVFTIDGNIPTTSKNKTTLIVSKSFSSLDIEDKKKFSLNRLKQIVDNSKLEQINAITIDDISGYEMIAIGKDKQTKEVEKNYLVLLFVDDLYYILMGSTNQDFEQNINNLRKSIKTFKRK